MRRKCFLTYKGDLFFFWGGGEGDVPAKYFGTYRIHGIGRFTYVGLTFMGDEGKYTMNAPLHAEVLPVKAAISLASSMG